MMGGPRRRGAPMPRMSIKGQGHILKRLMKIVFENYLWQFIAVIVCIVVTAYATIQSSTFTRDLVDVYIAGIQKGTKTMGDLANAMIPLGCVLALGRQLHPPAPDGQRRAGHDAQNPHGLVHAHGVPADPLL